jgi:putative NADPH-quinone reductase
MQCLVVSAHPLEKSLCSTLTERIVTDLQAAGHTVTIEDLYQEVFDPVLSREERISYYREDYRVDAVAKQVTRLLAAEAIVLVFPTWWFSMPAILKGWFDRVWIPGVAYDHTPDFGPIQPRLNTLRYMLAVTTLGAPWWVDRLVLRQPVKKVLKFALVAACAPQCRFQMLSHYKCERLTQQQVASFSKRIRKIVLQWPQ